VSTPRTSTEEILRTTTSKHENVALNHVTPKRKKKKTALEAFAISQKSKDLAISAHTAPSLNDFLKAL
jgi:hypothetical protein